MDNKKLFLVSLAILTIFMLGAVSATNDISIENLTVEESTLDSIEEVNDEVELGENKENDLMESSDLDNIVSDKQSITMNVGVWDSEMEEYYTELTSYGNHEDLYIKVSLSEKVSGTLSLYMDGKFVSNKTITAKTHYFNFGDVKEIGKHTAEVCYSGNDNYNPNSASSTFEIVSCYIDCSSVVYGDNNLLIYIDAAEPTGDVVAIINGKRYTAPVIRGIASIEIENLNIGEYPIHIDYSGNLAPRSFDGTFNVSPEIITDYKVRFNEVNEVSLRLPSNAKGNLLVKVDGQTVANVALVNGYARVSLNNFRELWREYDIEAEYTGIDYHVDPLDTTFEIIPQIEVEYDMILNQEYTLTFTLPSTYSGDLWVNAPGYDDSIDAKVVNGKASVKFLAKSSGFEDIFIGYEDEDHFYETAEPIFVGPNPNMVATVDSKVGQNPVFKVNVANDAGGAISVFINGKEYTSSYFTKSGSLTIPGLADGTYTAIVTYSGDYKYPSVSKTITFTKTSKKASKTKISLKLTKVTVKKSAKKLVLKATLKINGKVAKNKKITFKFNKKTYKAKTNKKGVAKVTIKKSVLKKLKVGKKIKYQASYGKTTVKKTVKVKK